MTTTLEQPADTGGDLLADLNDALRDAMEGHDAGFAAARAAWAEVLAAKMEGAALDKRLAELVAELDAVRERLTRQTDEILERKRAAEQRVISGIHAERALMLSLPAALTAAMDAASKRAGELERLAEQLRVAAEGARRDERENLEGAANRSHPADAAFAEPFVKRAAAAKARAAAFADRRDAANRERNRLLTAITEANRKILS
ncbi:MAG: hypothetical protein KF861_00720 [Planctomycetaceae bacterium]|nr:hypothetical protein [Planctomycetaceae bacterium]